MKTCETKDPYNKFFCDITYLRMSSTGISDGDKPSMFYTAKQFPYDPLL